MYRPADLVFVNKHTIISKLVSFFSRSKHESPTFATHVMGFCDSMSVIEASFITKKYKFYESKVNYEYEVWRNIAFSYDETLSVVDEAGRYLGKKYGYFKLAMHILDTVLEKILGYSKPIYLFRRFCNNDDYPICSWLWGYSYKKSLGYQFGIDPKYLSPDDMYDYVRNHNLWVCIKYQGK